MTDLPYVSVIIPAKNVEATINECLDSLMAQDYKDFEIIIVDNGSTDATQKIISSYSVTFISENKPGAYLARNTGIRHARGEILAFTDADCVADKAWLKELVSCFKVKGIGGCGGDLLAFKPINLVEQFLSLGKLRLYHTPNPSEIIRKKNHFLSGALGSANMAFRSSVLKKLDGFDPTLKDFGGDYDLSWRIQNLGYPLLYNPQAVVYHRMRNNIKKMFKQFYYFGQNIPLLLKQQPDRSSFIQLKTYILPVIEFRLKLPFRFLISFDILFLFPLFLIFSIFMSEFLSLVLITGIAGISGAIWSAGKIVKRTGKFKWMVLYPYYHFIRIIAFTAGKITGGIKHGLLSM